MISSRFIQDLGSPSHSVAGLTSQSAEMGESMPVRALVFVVLVGALGFPSFAYAQMYCRESVSDNDYKIEVSVCVTDEKRDLIVHVRNLDRRRKEITFPECSVDITAIVYESRPNNRHIIAPQIPSHVARSFRTLDTRLIQCMYHAKILEQQAAN
jgi:hypothetical protein